MNGVTVGGPGLVAVGNDGFDAAVWISSDGVTWSRVPLQDTQVSDSEWLVTGTFERTGLHALNCYDMTTGGQGVDYPNLITVSE